MRTAKNKGFLELLDFIDFISVNTKSDYQRDLVKEYAEFALFLAVNHPLLKQGIESLLNKFTKYDDIEIDLEPCLGRIDKFLFNKILKYVVKRFTGRPTYKLIMYDSDSNQNAIAVYFMAHIDDALKEIRDVDDYMYRVLKSFAWFGVWVGINDTAWRHQFYYAAKKYGNDDIMILADEYYREPKDWFINLYTEGVEETQKLRAKNKIPHHESSILEAPCVVHNQQKVIKDYNDKYGVK